jgi:ribosome-associated protein
MKNDEGSRPREPLSKTQKKRDATALQKVGTSLVAFTPAMLDKIPMPDFLRQAIDDAKIIKSHEGKRRQAQLIGKLIRQADHEEIVLAYKRIIAGDSQETARFKELERLRDKLINHSEALTEFIKIHPDCDEKSLHILIQKAIDEKDTGKPKGAGRALFRFLKNIDS